MLKLITKVKIPKPDGSEAYKDFPTDRLEFKKAQPQNSNKKGKGKDEDDDEPISEDMKKLLD